MRDSAHKARQAYSAIFTGESSMHKLIATLTTLSLGLFAVPPGALAQDSEEEPVIDENTERCISLRRLRSTDVINDRTIIFRLRGGEIFLNILPRTCPGLGREKRISYSTNVNAICEIDHIAVLHAGAGNMFEGARCRLGVFHRISADDAKAIKEGGLGPPPEPAAPLPMPEPGEVNDEDDEPRPPR